MGDIVYFTVYIVYTVMVGFVLGWHAACNSFHNEDGFAARQKIMPFSNVVFAALLWPIGMIFLIIQRMWR